MRHRPVYRGDGWILAVCTRCQRTNYVEPHGTTAPCLCSKGLWTEHTSIPEAKRLNGLMGPFVLVDTHAHLTALTTTQEEDVHVPAAKAKTRTTRARRASK